MQFPQASMIDTLKRIRGFLDANPDKLGAVAKNGTSKRLDDAIADLLGHAESQSGSFLKAKGSTKEQHKLREALLRDHMAPIAEIAKNDLKGTPNIEPLSLPKGRLLGERLVAAAKGMGETAAQFSQTFIDAGLEPDFVQQLNAAA